MKRELYEKWQGDDIYEHPLVCLETPYILSLTP